jgi:surfactin synthase thioesterase subunit
MNRPHLFILHFAGGNKYSYQPIINHFGKFSVEVLELPGRGRRMKEDLLYDQEKAVEDLYQQIAGRIPRVDYLIYGHSMGATLGLKLAKKLIAEGLPPKGLFVTGNPGPGIENEVIRHNLPREEFIKELKKLGGVPDEVFQSEELYNFFEPVLRADFKIAEENASKAAPLVNIPIYAVMGEEEDYVEDLKNWKKFTTSTFECEVWPGNHFFIFENGEKLAERINRLASAN